MRILYLSLSYVPSRRASSVQVMKTCAALARQGHDVVLVAKAGDEPSVVDDHDFYRVEKSFAVDKISRPQMRGGGVAYVAGLASRVLKLRREIDLAYCRDPLGALLAAEAGLPVVFEAHEIPRERWLRAAIRRSMRGRRVLGMVAISHALRRDLIEAELAPVGKPLIVAHDACDAPMAPAGEQRSIGAPPRIGYVGSLYPGRGIDMIVELARRMPACRFRVVGGSEPDLARWRAKSLPENLELLGFRPQAELPALYAELDVVLLPHAAAGVVGATGSDISKWTSPMKMFEYMASGAAIVASDLPVLQEVLRDEDNALVAPVTDPEAWRAAIERLLGDEALRSRLVASARADVEQFYTWDARMATVMRGLGFEVSLS